ncbi:MAG TPA: hypothetical protein VK054_09510, partial [Beutenbergiaceae bacterium]|nr:hypothetical protein [Beutenbergiaceae bacterium]
FGAVFFYTPGVKAIRTRRRRHAPTPEARAWGAWVELLDYHRDTGEAIPVQASRREVAHSLGVGDTAIATTVDQAMYSHEGLTSSQADGIWEQVHTSIDDHRKRQTRWKRITRVYSRRSFKPDGEQPQRKART